MSEVLVNYHDTNEQELPRGWEEVPLSRLCQINPGADFVGLSDDDPVSFLPMPAVKELSGRIDTSVSKPLGQLRKGYTRFQENDVLFAKITPSMENGKVAVARGLTNGYGCGSTEFHVLRPYSGIAPDFVFYFLVQDRFRAEAQRSMRGAAGQLRVPPEFLESASIPCPPSAEQRRIVAKLDELFSQIEKGEENLRRVQALVKQYRQSVLKAAVTGELTRDWREKHGGQGETGAELLQRILAARRAVWQAAGLKKIRAKGRPPKDEKWKQKYKEPEPPDTTNLLELPKGWVWVTVDQVTSLVQYGSSAKCTDRNGVPVLRMGNIVDGQLDYSDLKYLPESHSAFPDLLLKRGDLLFNRTNSAELVGKSAVYDGHFEECSFASYLIRVRPIGFDSRWLAYFINSILGRQWVAQVNSQQVGQANVNGSKLKALAVPLPPPEELALAIERVEEELSVIVSVVTGIVTQTKRTRALRQSVLSAAFSGKLAPQDPDDEPAGLLLKRIAAERVAQHADPPKRDRGKKTKEAAE